MSIYKNYVCALFVNNDKIFCCKSLTNPDYWELPHSDKTYEIIANTLMDSLKAASKSDFQFGYSIGSQEFDDGFSKMWMELIFDYDENIQLVHQRECRWVDIDEINTLKWDSFYIKFINDAKQKLAKKHYKITLYFTDDSEVTIFEEYCSEFKMLKEFQRICKERSEKFHLGQNDKLRQVRVYSEEEGYLFSERYH